MDKLIEEYNEIIKSDGPWSAHNILIKDNLFTIKEGIVHDEFKVRRVIQNIKDLTKKDFHRLKILDLACLEGMFGLECARQGAEVTFIDIRDVNLRKVEFVAKAHDLKNITTAKADVRDISAEKFGKFDVILCFGIFYHLDKSDLFGFVKNMHDMADEFVFFDTHITEKNKEHFRAGNVDYWGKSYREHKSNATPEEIESDLWKSFGNTYSFILTKSSLIRMIQQAGFTSAFESYFPVDITKDITRISIIAMKGSPVEVLCSNEVNKYKDEIVPEITRGTISKQKRVFLKNDIRHFFSMNTPKPIKRVIKKVIKGK